MLNSMDPEKDTETKFNPKDLEEMKNISATIRYEEIINITETKTSAFEDTISKYDERIKELREKLSIVSDPRNPEK